MTASLRRILAALSACLIATACVPQQASDAPPAQARPAPGARAPIDRQQAEAHRQLGLGLEAAGDIAGAVDEFEAALALGRWPLAPAAGGLADSPYGDLARICWRNEPAEQVARACTRVIESYRFQSSRLAELFANRAAARLRLGDPDRALADYRSVLKIDPNNPRGLLVRGQVRAREGRHGAALIDFNRVLANGPDRLDARYARALSLAALGDLEGAIADYDYLLSDPEGIAAYPDAYRDRAEAYCQTGQAGAASVGWQVWLGARPDGPAYVQEMLLARGYLRGAVADDFTPEALAALRDWTKAGCPEG
ncbi:MAG: tetratricopeptide repeat protein [Alphaproteobacteria bacterium]